MRPARNAEFLGDEVDDDFVGFDDVTVEFRRPWLYPKQLAAIYSPARMALIEASTKAGKTVGCIIWLVEQALFGGGEARNYWWVAPVSTQADIAFSRMLRYLPAGSFNANITLKTIILFNGAVIWFKGADRPDTLYGDDVHAAVIDEGSRVKREAWHAVRSTLTATRGPVRIIGNVKGRKNWFYELARRAEKGDRPALMTYHKITADDAVQAGVLVGEEIEEAREVMPEDAFLELYYAQATDDGANPFGLAAIKSCIQSAGFSIRPTRCWGWDLGKKRDWTCGIGLDDFGQTTHAVRFQKPWPEAIKEIRRVTGKVPALVDSTGLGDPVLEVLQRPGAIIDSISALPLARPGHQVHHNDSQRIKLEGSNFEGFTFTQASKQRLFEGLAVGIQSQAVGFPDGGYPQRGIVLELESFEFQHTRSGIKYSAPEGFHDDWVCALGLAYLHLQHAPRPFIVSADVLKRAALPARPRA